MNLRPLVPEWYNQAYAAVALGWEWMSFVDTPAKSCPTYPQEQRVRQFMSPAQLCDARWKIYLEQHEGRPADGTEPLAYCYSSGRGLAMPPDVLDGLSVKLQCALRDEGVEASSELGARLVTVVQRHLAGMLTG
jgi:hypothetical protein